jgi:hypothetical protein
MINISKKSPGNTAAINTLSATYKGENLQAGRHYTIPEISYIVHALDTNGT